MADVPFRIVILDAEAANPGDLGWEPVERVGTETTIYPVTNGPDEAAQRAAHADALLINKVTVDDALLAAAPGVRYVGVQATGYNVVDLAAARARGVAVTNVPGYGTMSVAQHVFGLLLELAGRIAHHAQWSREGRWSRAPIFTIYEKGLVELDGLTLGIVGYGAIGRAVARIGRAFGMRILAHTRRPAEAEAEGVECVSLDALFARADVLSLHCPLTPETSGLVNAERLALMKPSAFLINTGRGQLVDEAALAAALRAGRLAGAGLDVLCEEPPPADNPLLTAPRTLITPHIAWATRAARGRLIAEVAANLSAYRAGLRRNRVD